MKPLEEAIAHIEAVTGQEYGEWPWEMRHEDYKEIARQEYIQRHRRGEWFGRAMSRFAKKTSIESMYLSKYHGFVIAAEHTGDKRVYLHECIHGFEKNKWPHLYQIDINQEILFLRSCVLEGIADYISLSCEGDVSEERREELRGKPKNKSTTQNLLWEYEDGPMMDCRFREYSQSLYALGLALAKTAVEQAGDVWTGLDNLARNPPTTITEAYNMLEVER